MKKKLVTISVALIVSILVGCSAKQTEPASESEPTVEQTVQDQSVTETTPEQTPPAESIPDQPESTDPVESVPEQPEQTPPTESAPEKPVETQTDDLFTDTNETVYAVSTVNIRSKPDTNSEKLGQLNWSDSVIRTGVGIDEVADWSEVRLSDGSTAYISSKYLSTTKPVEKPAEKPADTQKPADKPVETPKENNQSSTSDDLQVVDPTQTDSWKEATGGLTGEEWEKALEEARKRSEEEAKAAGGYVNEDGNIVLPPPW